MAEEAKKVKLVEIKFLGNKKQSRYSGYDAETKSAINCQVGSVVQVSEAKAEQLQKDFPDQWGDADAVVPESDPVEEAQEVMEEEEEPTPEKKKKKKKGKK